MKCACSGQEFSSMQIPEINSKVLDAPSLLVVPPVPERCTLDGEPAGSLCGCFVSRLSRSNNDHKRTSLTDLDAPSLLVVPPVPERCTLETHSQNISWNSGLQRQFGLRYLYTVRFSHKQFRLSVDDSRFQFCTIHFQISSWHSSLSSIPLSIVAWYQ